MVARYEGGETVYELAASFGIHRNTVSQHLEQHEVPRRYHQMTDVDLERAAELHASGLNLTQVAAQMGIGRTTLIRARGTSRSV